MRNRRLPYERIHAAFFLAVTGIFLLLVSPGLLTEGMFLDGLWYSSIADNLSSDLTRLWHLSYTDTISTRFYSHPPLAIWLESLWFAVLGDAFWVEKLCSFSCVVLAASVLVLIWKQLGFEMKYSFLPLFFLVLVPDISWAATNNMLENTMMIFVLLTVLFMLKSHEGKRKWLFVLLSSLTLFLSFMTKGFTGLYTLAFPFCMWLVRREETFMKMFCDTLCVLVLFMLWFALMVTLSDSAQTYFRNYFSLVLSGVEVRTVSSRFTIIYKFVSQLLPSVCVLILFALCGIKFRKNGFRKEKNLFRKEKNGIRIRKPLDLSAVFMLLALCGVVPVMLSLKQRGFYVLTVYPFCAIAFSVLVLPTVKKMFEIWNDRTKNIIFAFSLFLFVSGIAANVFNFGRVGRDETKIEDMKVILRKVGRGDVVSVPVSMRREYTLYGYYYRYGKVSLTHLEMGHEWLLLEDGNDFEAMRLDTLYVPEDLPTKRYRLYRLKR